ncbi:MAG: carbohydrate binding domain-containing protein [Victivallales bacterium]|nr:carbohydrate binding domain-containing protein [Victivallales bacterium]
MFSFVLSILFFSAAYCVELRLEPGASVSGGIYDFSVKGACATVQKSEAFNAGERGLTISAAVKFSSTPKIEGSGLDENKAIIYNMDVIASKGGEFVFARRADAWVNQMYLNFKDGGEWKVPLKLGGKTHKLGTWAIWTVTMLPQIDVAQGRRQTTVRFYMNGELVHQQEVQGVPALNQQPIIIGKGQGIKDEEWGFKGSLAELEIVPKALEEEEVQELVSKSRLVKLSFRQAHKLTPGFLAAFANVEKGASDTGKWMLEALKKAVVNGLPESQVLELLKSNEKTFAEKDAASIAKRLGQGGKPLENGELRKMPKEGLEKLILSATGKSALRLFCTGKWDVLVLEGEGIGTSPLLGMREHCGNSLCRELLGNEPLSWKLELPDGKKLKAVSPYEYKWRCIPVKSGKGAGAWLAYWMLPDNRLVYMNMAFMDDMADLSLDAIGYDEGALPVNVQFPILQFAHKKEGTDYLVHAVQGGCNIPNPISAELSQGTWYPCGHLSMQFGAYYDDASGIYFSPEDRAFGIFRYGARGRKDNLQVQWTFPQARHCDVPFYAHIRLRAFQGDWFDAAQVYKKHFALANFKPRRRQPWFEENCFWLSHWTYNEKELKNMPSLMAGIRKFMEMPMSVHWYRWVDNGKGGWPHFKPKEGVKEANEKMLKDGVFTTAYIDTRLWSELDGPGNKTDWEYSAKGKPSAAVNWDGSLNKERYRAACEDVVMCPNAKVWQETMAASCLDVAKAGFKGIYHDQVGASRPFPCYPGDVKKHNHIPGEPHAWTRGYYEMFARINMELGQFPDVVHTTEDANDAYINQFDAFLPWRWVQQNQIPLFAAVYAGHTQFMGRVYDNSGKGTFLSHFVKSGTQLVNGEQIGWFTYTYLKRPAFALYVKRLCHTRKMLLGYMNSGDMEHPVRYQQAPASQTTLWGQGSGKPANVTLPAILSSSWRAQDGKEVVIFLNTAETPQKALPIVPEKGTWYSCKADGSCTMLKPGAVPMEIAAQRLELWSNDANEARRLAEELKRFETFEFAELGRHFGILAPGASLPVKVDFDEMENARARTGKGCLELKGDASKTINRKLTLLLEPGARYRVSLWLRKEGASTCRVSASNYSKGNKLKHYFYKEAKVPADDAWHQFSTEFTTDAELHNVGLYIHNVKSQGIVFCDDVVIEKL